MAVLTAEKQSLVWDFFSKWASGKSTSRRRKRFNVTRQALLEAWGQEVGVIFGQPYVKLVWSLSNRLPTLSYLQGYSFVGFLVKGVDPYALVAPDGRILKVWLELPSLTELWEAIHG